jgi:hypothetical protein
VLSKALRRGPSRPFKWAFFIIKFRGCKNERFALSAELRAGALYREREMSAARPPPSSCLVFPFVIVSICLARTLVSIRPSLTNLTTCLRFPLRCLASPTVAPIRRRYNSRLCLHEETRGGPRLITPGTTDRAINRSRTRASCHPERRQRRDRESCDSRAQPPAPLPVLSFDSESAYRTTSLLFTGTRASPLLFMLLGS